MTRQPPRREALTEPMAQVEPDDPMIGQQVGGRYELVENIGEGGMGTVYKARQRPIGRFVALKLLDIERCLDDRAVRRFLTEAKAISRLRHPNTIKLLDFGKNHDGRLYLVMPYLTGGELTDLIEQGPLEQLTALKIVAQIARSLAEAHEANVIHRDLKPENVVFDTVHGQPNYVKLLDFGVALLQDDHAEITLPGTRLGTPDYMAPEQHAGRPADHRADLYALGVMLYEMLAGEAPFEGETETEISMLHQYEEPRLLSELRVDLDPLVCELVLQLMAKAPEDRPESAEAVADLVDHIISRLESPDARRQGRPLMVTRPPSRRPSVTREDMEDELSRLRKRHKLLRLATLLFAIGMLGASTFAFLH